MLGLHFFPGNRRSWSQLCMSTKSTPKSLPLPYVVAFSSEKSPRTRLRLGLRMALVRICFKPQRQPLAVRVTVAMTSSFRSIPRISVSPRSLIAAQSCLWFTRERRLLEQVSLPTFRLFLDPRPWI